MDPFQSQSYPVAVRQIVFHKLDGRLPNCQNSHGKPVAWACLGCEKGFCADCMCGCGNAFLRHPEGHLATRMTKEALEVIREAMLPYRDEIEPWKCEGDPWWFAMAGWLDSLHKTKEKTTR